MKVNPLHNLPWHGGPRFDYRADGRKVAVNVVGSSWGIHNMPLAEPVRSVLRQFRPIGGNRVLDFGAGSWLRYVRYVRRNLNTREVYAVEFEEAFHDDSAKLKARYAQNVTFWTPKSFEKQRDEKFDLILLVNVLNTMPEEEHQRDVFRCLSKRLELNGWLLVYQRVWTAGVNPTDALPYGNGWFIPQQPRYDYYTYRAGTGAIWFNKLAKECGLDPVVTKAENKFTSNNTLLKVWEKPFAN
jgi:hypothetical protein